MSENGSSKLGNIEHCGLLGTVGIALMNVIILIAGQLKPLLTPFGIHHGLESCGPQKSLLLVKKFAIMQFMNKFLSKRM